MRTRLVVLLVTLCFSFSFGFGCSIHTNKQATPLPAVITAKVDTPPDTPKTTIVQSTTKPEYAVVINPAYKNPEIVQFISKLRERCDCSDDLLTQTIQANKGENNVFRLILWPHMTGRIVFQVLVDDDQGNRMYLDTRDWPAVEIYDGARRVNVTTSGTYHNGGGIFKIWEKIYIEPDDRDSLNLN